jgi:hypothetical protein
MTYNIWTADDPESNYLKLTYGAAISMGGAAKYPWLYGLWDGIADGSSVAPAVSPTVQPPQFSRISFDTIGQVIFRSIGSCRLPLRPIWAQGINESGDVAVSNTQTAAYAVCAPIDPDEEIELTSFWDGGSAIFSSGGVVVPPGWSDADAALLAASLAAVVIYPGDEAQLPAPLIVADKGADKTNAFRGIRYIIIPDYPINGGPGGGGGGLPPLSVGVNRTNEPDEEGLAVEFLAGAA